MTTVYCISCRVPLRWPPQKSCASRQPHYDYYNGRPLNGLSAMLWDLREASEVYAGIRGAA